MDKASVRRVVTESRELAQRLKQLENVRAKLSAGEDAHEACKQLEQADTDLRLQREHVEAAVNARIHGRWLSTLTAALEAKILQHKQQFGMHLKQTLESSMQSLFLEQDGVQGNDGADQAVLNEEGLPFVDPVEQLPDSPPATPDISMHLSSAPVGNILDRAPGSIVPFERSDAELGERDRREWMDAMLDILEKEEEEEEEQNAADAPLLAAMPQPDKEAPSKLESFRRGFLHRRTETDNATPASTEDNAVRPKKHVRIAEQEPESSEEEDEVPREKRSRAVQYGQHPDDVGVEKEAARIVNLLGPQVIEGHPNADRILAELEASNTRVVQKTPEPTAAGPARPAIGEAIVERNEASFQEPLSSAPRKKVSAFKRRQLARQEAEEEPIPNAPTVSQGIPAIERAGRAEEGLASQRASQGLPPQIPHARPTKAYAERLRQRREANAQEAVDGENDAPPLSATRKVRFGSPTVVEAEAMDEEDTMSPMDEADDDVPMQYDSEDSMQSGDDTLWDSDDEYDLNDLASLRPSMEGHAEDPYWDEQLAKEYAEAQARLGAIAHLSTPARNDASAEESYGIAPLDSSVADRDDTTGNTAREHTKPNVSRFKAARIAGDAVPNPTWQLDHGAKQDEPEDSISGVPVMVLPSLAPVRFAKHANPDTRQVDVDGESDEDDDRLQALMRARLDIAEHYTPPTKSALRKDIPPQVQAKK
ncbi:hypothetical protein MVES1_002399 [Malassezia vespertilionis]|uniref:Uncharacterized protein n=1 Tax=Malassezia vespertilionis TaxID=2020962 RepID=A0A2N1JBJ3_9BASI|nr:uncharacterized protein MVES1_002399 [Malassezia vespertilionis]PKI83917.1 hypothetical protein MVES_002267 [Malassezia vespertilionis]WFD07043.1 hypothetical protein MVES1_002399 [Malassezia vespertilionis]